MNFVDYILIGIIILAVAGAIFLMVRRKKSGGCCGTGNDCSSCGGKCAGCNCSSCAERNLEKGSQKK